MSESILNIEAAGPLTDQMGYSVAQAMNKAPDYSFILEGHHNPLAALSWFFGSFASRLTIRYGNVLSTQSGSAGLFSFAPGKSPSLFSVIQAGALSLPHHFGLKGAWRAFLLGMHLERTRFDVVKVPHWYLLAVGVTPQQQGQGIGLSLIEKTLNRCDVEGVPCYLEVFEAHLIPLYERLGFRVQRQQQLANGLTLWSLLRQPIANTEI